MFHPLIARSSGGRGANGQPGKLTTDGLEVLHALCDLLAFLHSHGIVDRDHGVFIFPDANAAGQGHKPQHLYSVRFSAHELWGQSARRDCVYLDLWEDYLERV